MYKAGHTVDDFKKGSGPNLPPLELEPPRSASSALANEKEQNGKNKYPDAAYFYTVYTSS